MSVEILKQAYDDVRRCSIAGSVVSANDFRLKKLVAPLEQVGHKAPVFAKVAQAVTRLIESNEKQSAEALLELSTLVNAILYTQGETGADGELQPIETTDLGQHQTRASSRVLKPLLEALTTTGSGRIELIKDAHERGAFRDLRLVGPALTALDDPYAEISAFMAEQVLPMYGTAIVPELRNKLDLNGRGGHVHRLLLMHRLDPDGARATLKQALDEGSKEIRVAAIECLGDSSEDLAFLLEQAKAKALDVRNAALRALCKCDANKAMEALRAAFKSGQIESATKAVTASPNPRLKALVLEEAASQWDTLLAGKEKDKTKLAQQVTRFLITLECLRDRTDAAAEKFLTQAFGQREALAAIKSAPGGESIEQMLTSIMASGPKGAQLALADAHETLRDDELADAFVAACRSRTPAEVYDLFSPYFTGKFHLRKKSRDAASMKREAIAAALIHGMLLERFHDASGSGPAPTTRIDPRWLNLAVRNEHLELVRALAVPGHEGADKLLTKAFDEQLKKSRDPDEVITTLRTMVRVKHAEAADAVVATISKHAKGARPYALYLVGPLICQLPKEAVPKLEEMLKELPEKVVDQLLDVINQLKTRPDRE